MKTPSFPKNHARRSAFTLIELLVVIVIIAILATLSLKGIPKAFELVKKAQAKADANSIVQAIKLYQSEYARFPTPSGGQGEGPYETKQAMMDVLMADKHSPEVDQLNPKKISFYEPPTMTDKPRTRGFHSRKHELYDPWGTPYKIYMDTDFDDQVEVPPGYTGDSGRAFIRKSVIVYSAGPDTKFETKNDNVTTWE